MKSVSLNVGSLNIVAMVSEMSGDAMIALRPFVEHLGLDRATQQRKVMKNPQFSWRLMPLTGSDGKQYEMLCIPVKQLGMWLCTVNANRVKPEIREKLIQFQMHLQVAIHDALTGRVSWEVVEALRAEVNEIRQHVQFLIQENAQLRQALADSADYLASAAAYGMHAAKKTKHLRVVN